MNNFYNFLSALNLPNNLDFSTNLIILNYTSLFLLLVIFKIIRTVENVSLVALSSLVSILLVLIYLSMDAPDVAMTETSVNVCLSTLISLAALKKLGKQRSDDIGQNSIFGDVLALFLCLTIAIFFIYISLDLKEFGAPWARIHNQVGKFYIDNTMQDLGIASIVCAILASYRGFDTMGETAVIASAVIAVLYILSINYQNNEENKTPYPFNADIGET